MSLYSEICFLVVIVFFSVLCDARVSIDYNLGPKKLKEVIKDNSTSKATTYKVKKLSDNKIGGSKEITSKNTQVEEINSVVNSSVEKKIDSKIDSEIDSKIDSKEGSVVSGEPKEDFENKMEEREVIVKATKEKKLGGGSEQLKDKPVIPTQEKLLEVINQKNSYKYGDKKSSENVIPKINTSKVEKTERVERDSSLSKYVDLDNYLPKLVLWSVIACIIYEISSNIYELLASYPARTVATTWSLRSLWKNGLTAPLVVESDIFNQNLDAVCSRSSMGTSHCKYQMRQDVSTAVQIVEAPTVGVCLGYAGAGLETFVSPVFRSATVSSSITSFTAFLGMAWSYLRFRPIQQP